MSTPSTIARQWKFDAPITALTLNRRGDYLAASLGDGQILLFEANDLVEEPQKIAAHNGISLSLAPDADEHAFLSGGDDGQVLIIEPGIETPTILATHKGQWIDHVAAGIEGHRAYSIGKKLYVLGEDGQPTGEPYALPSSAGGMAFNPSGKRLAVSHYNGVSLFWTKAKDTPPTTLPWKGSHLPVIWTPDGKIIMSSMQEGALHGWRIADNQEMQMQGYATKIYSLAFTARGKYLATGGANQVICWPFFNGGPWGKQPMTLGGADDRLVTRVAPHPRDEIVAAGYEDGMIILSPLDGRMEVMLHPPVSKEAAIVGMEWNAAGDCLFVARTDGAMQLFTLASVGRAFRP